MASLSGLVGDIPGVAAGKYLYGKLEGEGAPPGVAGAATSGQPVVYDPGTGLYVNQATGAVSTDAAGQHPVNDPSLATQATRNLATSGQFLQGLGSYAQQYNGTLANENSLGAHLNATINGTAPSVAQSQLEQGLAQIAQQQQAQASGATGSNAALARTDAAANTGAAQAATNAQEAGVRANEVAGAETAESGLLNNEANQVQQAKGTDVNAAENFSGLAGTEQGNQATLTQKGNQAQLTTIGTVAGAAGQAGAGTTSDVNEKTNVKGADMDEFLSKLGGITFNYKSPDEAGQSPGTKLGVKAQDVKKSKVGKKIVMDDAGTLKLNPEEMQGAILAALGHLHRKIEGRA